jgi:hypothetical protein
MNFLPACSSSGTNIDYVLYAILAVLIAIAALLVLNYFKPGAQQVQDDGSNHYKARHITC